MSKRTRQRKPAPSPKRGNGRWLLALLVALVISGALGFWITKKIASRRTSSRDASKSTASADIPKKQSDAEIFSAYAGSQTCRECHAPVFDLFTNSHHALAERPIDPKNDKRFFDPSHEIHHGTQTSFASFTNGPAQLRAASLEGGIKDFPLERVIGVAPLRQFLAPTHDGRFQVTELAVDPKRGDWFDMFGSEDRTPGEWGHWLGRGMNWNNMCAACHNTRVRKNYQDSSDRYSTTMAESTVSCEACHGPMKSHVTWQKEKHVNTPDPTLAHFNRDQVLDTCGSCHSRRAELTGNFQPGDKFFDHFALTIPDETDIYFADGQVHDEDYEFASFLGSKMHAAGVRCVDCHNPHSAKIKFPGNAICLQCHGAPVPPAPKIDEQTHTFHTAGKPGSQCVDCHMPQTTYMQRHARRDHGFTIPDPLLTKKFEIPNACNRCHTDHDADWALGFVEKWYGTKMDRFTRTRAEVIAEARTENSTSAKLLGILPQETNSYWRAVEVGLLRRWVAEPRVRSTLLASMENTNSLVRVTATRSLEPLASQGLQTNFRKQLTDNVRGVRVEAAWGLSANVDTNSLAGRELLESLENNADQPAGALQLGTFYFGRGENERALGYFERAVKWDSNSAPFHHALAVCLSVLGNSARAIEELKTACRLAPNDAEYFYKLGLALNETGNLKETVAALKRATEIDPQFARAWYNLGLGYSALQQPELALESLRRAESIDPNQAQYPYARATILARLGRNREARIAAERALELQPSFSDAANLLRTL